MVKLILLFLFLFNVLNSGDAFSSDTSCDAFALNPSLLELEAVGSTVIQSNMTWMVWQCTQSLFEGTWQSTGGAGTSAWNCVTDPIDCATSAIDGVKNAWNFISNLSRELNSIYSSLAELPASEMASLICELVGALAPPVIGAILSGGATSAMLAATLQKISFQFAKIGKIIKSIQGVSHKTLAKFSDEALEQLEELSEAGYGGRMKDIILGSCR